MSRFEKELDAGQQHIFKLIGKDAGEDGWVPVSSVVRPFVVSLPIELVEVKPGFARLTDKGKNVFEWVA